MRERIPANLYQYLVVESRGICSLCHESAVAHIHHIKPIAEGGPSDYRNLIPICANCHSRVHRSRVSRRELHKAKTNWTRENNLLLSKLISRNDTYDHQKRQFLKAFDAVDDIRDFEKFRVCLRQMLDRHKVFQLYFRVQRHDILQKVDEIGNSTNYDRQRFSPFIEIAGRWLQISGAHEASPEEIAFCAKAWVSRKHTPVTTKVRFNSPKLKTYDVEFPSPIPPNAPSTLEYRHFWPKGWLLPHDEYTYDILAWVEELNYEIVFPKQIHVTAVSTFFVDMFGRSWPDIGKYKITRNGFRWSGKRLPMCSRIILRHETDFKQK